GTRQCGRFCIALFVLSPCFPVTASIYHGDVSRWLAFADVTLAVVLLSTVIALCIQTQARVTNEDRLKAWQISQTLISAIPALLVLFFINDRPIAWDVLVIGLAWRGWLLLYSLPYLV